jgi:hypothetical protein
MLERAWERETQGKNERGKKKIGVFVLTLRSTRIPTVTAVLQDAL